MKEFSDFKNFVSNTIEIVLLDLEKLKQLAESGNEYGSIKTTTIQTTIRPDDNTFAQDLEKTSRCTIPISMVCFSVIDMIGQWLNEGNDDDFGASAHVFFSKLSNKDDLKKDNAKNKMKDIFRNGIMHSFFALKGYSVTYLEYETNTLFIDLAKTGSTLNVKYLLDTVENGLQKLKTELVNEESILLITAFKGYQQWSEKWKMI